MNPKIERGRETVPRPMGYLIPTPHTQPVSQIPMSICAGEAEGINGVSDGAKGTNFKITNEYSIESSLLLFEGFLTLGMIVAPVSE